jgi:DnaJ homolog subfamily C member 9
MQITDEKLDAYCNSYRGSAHEKDELLCLYNKFKGDMNVVFEYVPCSDTALDSHRYMDLIDEAVSCGKAESFKVYEKWRRGISKKQRPKNPLKPKKSLGKKASDDADAALVAAIRSRVRFLWEGCLLTPTFVHVPCRLLDATASCQHLP